MTQPLSLSKQHLVFELQGNSRKSQTSLEIRNIENTRQLYKIMTTGRKRYIVKPSAGILEPFASAKIEIFLMLTDEDKDPDVLKDKFCIFTLPAADQQNWEKKAMDQYINDHRKEVQNIYFTASVSQKDKPNFLNGSPMGSEATNEERFEPNFVSALQGPAERMESTRSVSLPDDLGLPEANVRQASVDQRPPANDRLNAERPNPSLVASSGQEQLSGQSKSDEHKAKPAEQQRLMGFSESEDNSSVNVRLKQRVAQLEGELKILKVG